MTRLNRIALLLPLAAAALLALPRQAAAQCDGTEIFCASASISVGATVQVAPPPPRNAQVVITTQPAPPPPRVIVRAAPPPPPRVVVVRQAPPPPRQVVVVRQAAPQPRVVVRPLVVASEQRIGVHGHIGAMVGPDVQMGGFTAALRLRPVDHFALDIGLGAYGGQDYNGLDRVEVPLTLDALFYVNPRQRMQFYLLAGVGASRAHAEGFANYGGDYISREYTHVGGEAGLGLEWRLNPHFALTTDVRAFLRRRVNSSTMPEFVNPSTGETSDVSTGALITLGGTVYF